MLLHPLYSARPHGIVFSLLTSTSHTRHSIPVFTYEYLIKLLLRPSLLCRISLLLVLSHLVLCTNLSRQGLDEEGRGRTIVEVALLGKRHMSNQWIITD